MNASFAIFTGVFLGGGIGASLRWSVALAAHSLNLSLWPATLLVNAVGTLIYFLSVKYAYQDALWSSAFLRYGLLGSLTTFSTLSFEVTSLVTDGHYQKAALVFVLNILAGVLIAIGVFR